MDIKRSTLRRVIQILIPLMCNMKARKKLLHEALGEHTIAGKASLSGDGRVFTVNLVLELAETMPHQLLLLLREAQDRVDNDSKERFETLTNLVKADLLSPQLPQTGTLNSVLSVAKTRIETIVVPTRANISGIITGMGYLLDANETDTQLVSAVGEDEGLVLELEISVVKARRLAFIAQHYPELLSPFGIRRIQFSKGAVLLIDPEWKIYDVAEMATLTGLPESVITRITESNVIPRALIGPTQRLPTTGRLSLKSHKRPKSLYQFKAGAVNWMLLAGRTLRMAPNKNLGWLSELFDHAINQFDGNVESAYLTLSKTVSLATKPDHLQPIYDKLVSSG